ncbi:Glucose-fructose oxidoreductase domain-containing protein 1 [Trichinella nelsoni]|uniref:Glucose-fructose oxidoreductase domain-containing protein 1 n=2 Tax=Trichinella TaxID=6333 RepID=A0A0V0SC61_9BILA|nr:glucose-fructose oxidoreductase domain-containing protein 1 [Trichinella spiralis]KRX24230.1 Glucose-fructose oxidoreductase domain-containing protein 1 [Trichinella nelsoni]KRY30057.1 Glucose-fructose oxidoreductase domain-containing protein 1 [Trichinella spiralis]
MIDDNLMSDLGLVIPAELAQHFIPKLKELGYLTKALWTPDAAWTIQVAADCEVPFAASESDEVLLRKDVQLVLIIGCPVISAQISIKALGIGKHVICDIPASLNSTQTIRMVQAADYYPQLIALVGFGMRHLEIFQKMRQLLQQLAIGRLLLFEVVVRFEGFQCRRYNWKFDQLSGGGILNLVGNHIVDLICFLVGKRAFSVQGVVQNLPVKLPVQDDSEPKSAADLSGNLDDDDFRKMSADNYSSFIMHFEGGLHASVSLSALGTPNFIYQFLCWGTHGQLIVENCKLYLVRFTPQGPVKELILTDPHGALSNASVGDSFGYPNKSLTRLHQLTLQNTLQALSKPLSTLLFPNADVLSVKSKQNSLNSAASFEDALYVSNVLDALRISSLRGEETAIQFTPTKST